MQKDGRVAGHTPTGTDVVRSGFHVREEPEELVVSVLPIGAQVSRAVARDADRCVAHRTGGPLGSLPKDLRHTSD